MSNLGDKIGERKVGYPAAPPAYGYQHAAQQYSQQQQQAHLNQQAYAAAAAQAYQGYLQGVQGPPPPYSVAVSQPAMHPQLYQQVAGYPYGYVTQATQPGLMYPSTTYVVPGAYDAGARFDGIARTSVPACYCSQPPPPGSAPNAAQLAMMQGQNVVVTQQKGNFLSGGSDGGYTFW